MQKVYLLLVLLLVLTPSEPLEEQKDGSYRDSNAGPLASYAWVCKHPRMLSLSENHTTSCCVLEIVGQKTNAWYIHHKTIELLQLLME